MSSRELAEAWLRRPGGQQLGYVGKSDAAEAFEYYDVDCLHFWWRSEATHDVVRGALNRFVASLFATTALGDGSSFNTTVDQIRCWTRQRRSVVAALSAP